VTTQRAHRIVRRFNGEAWVACCSCGWRSIPELGNVQVQINAHRALHK
jgi:hypothetical protein